MIKAAVSLINNPWYKPETVHHHIASMAVKKQTDVASLESSVPVSSIVSQSSLSVLTCNRRQSRAARELVRQSLLAAASKNNGQHHGLALPNVNTETVWPLLQLYFSHCFTKGEEDQAKVKTCCSLFDPQRDIWKDHEEQSLLISWNDLKAAAASTANSAATKGSGGSSSSARMVSLSSAIPGAIHSAYKASSSSSHQRSSSSHASPHKIQLHQCGLCGKAFTSRYYLDKHFDRQHSLSLNHSTATRGICPATDWCGTFLSHVACHDMALLHEPWYGPGGGNGRDDDAHARANQRAWQQLVPPCRPHALQHASHTCRSMLQDCFNATTDSITTNTDAAHLVQALCAEQTCHGRLQQQLSRVALRPIVSLEDWYDLYHATERDHHRLGMVTVLVLVVVVVVCAWHLRDRRHRHHWVASTTGSRRLLRHGLPQTRRKGAFPWFPLQQHRPTTFIDVKRKQN
jgi:hypothetical protein